MLNTQTLTTINYTDMVSSAVSVINSNFLTLSSTIASELSAGLIKKASYSDIQTGTDDTKAVVVQDVLQTMINSNYIRSDNVVVSGDIIPYITSTGDFGTESLNFKNIYTNTLNLTNMSLTVSAKDLFVNDQKINSETVHYIEKYVSGKTLDATDGNNEIICNQAYQFMPPLSSLLYVSKYKFVKNLSTIKTCIVPFGVDSFRLSGTLINKAVYTFDNYAFIQFENYNSEWLVTGYFGNWSY